MSLGLKGFDKAFLKRGPIKVIEGTSDVLGPGQDGVPRGKHFATRKHTTDSF